jgi:uncharacterized protein
MPISWIYGFLGGLMIGGAATLYLLFNGKIMGVSGIVGGLVDRSGWSDWAERAAFIAGCVILPALIVPRLWPTETHLTGNYAVIIAAGLLVGLGTRLSNGCTSGHGVCGISRLSLRGIVATVFYILAGGITMALMRHVLGVI